MATDAFISGAPDSRQESPAERPKRVYPKKGRRIQRTITLTEDMLNKLDDLAERTGQSRNALINVGILYVLNNGVGGISNKDS